MQNNGKKLVCERLRLHNINLFRVSVLQSARIPGIYSEGWFNFKFWRLSQGFFVHSSPVSQKSKPTKCRNGYFNNSFWQTVWKRTMHLTTSRFAVNQRTYDFHNVRSTYLLSINILLTTGLFSVSSGGEISFDHNKFKCIHFFSNVIWEAVKGTSWQYSFSNQVQWNH